ncbi:MAG: glycosyl transferase, group 1 [Spirochaetaceae bacterium]|nr:glycosyl transferase, group 1 [Spirochaetaceae bacterium]|tara:strand:- start:15065 stop:16225 length:1161 start_codon:yes stop_codon:yes gene_type:complete
MKTVGSGPLRVLVWHWGRKGGGPRYTLELARALVSRKDIELFSSISRQSDFYDDFLSIPFVDRLDVDTYSSHLEFLIRSFMLPIIRRRLYQFIIRNEIDIVFCTMDHLWNSLVLGAIKKAGAKYLLTVHDAKRHPGEDQAWRRLLLEYDIRASDGALVLTEAVGNALQRFHKYPPDRIFYSLHGHFGRSVRERPRTLPRDRPLRILFFGRILPYKGLDFLLSALPLIREHFPDLELEIWGAGDVSEYRELEHLSNCRLENRWIEESEIPEIFERSDVLALPYREASQSGVVGLAFSSGMPCVAMPIPGLCEQVRNDQDGLIAARVDSAAFAACMIRLFSSEELYSRLSRGGIETARGELSWDAIGSSVAMALQNLQRIGVRAERVP